MHAPPRSKPAEPSVEARQGAQSRPGGSEEPLQALLDASPRVARLEAQAEALNRPAGAGASSGVVQRAKWTWTAGAWTLTDDGGPSSAATKPRPEAGDFDGQIFDDVTGELTEEWELDLADSPRGEQEQLPLEQHTPSAQQEEKKEEPHEEEERKEATPSLGWGAFSARYGIGKSASPIVQTVGATVRLNPEGAWPGKGRVGYVANILTTPGNQVSKIVGTYAAAGISEQNYGSFAMVIGVNAYRSLAGTTIQRVRDTAATGAGAPFPVAVLPFVWDFDWGGPFEEVRAAYMEMGSSDQQKALRHEKDNLVQSRIPYGQLRERIAADPATSEFVDRLAAKHDAVYVHLGDDDAASLPAPLLDRYSETIGSDFPPLVVGGYRFAAADQGGDLDMSDPGEALTEIANRLDTLFRSMLAEVNPDIVYPTEPNLAFLARRGKKDLLGPMLAPSKEESKRFGREERDAHRKQKGSLEGEPYFSTGLLYGRAANEGERLRDRIDKTNPSKGPVTRYDPRLAIATASTRFTLRDTDRVNHDPANSTYGAERRAAFEQGQEQGFMARVVHDLLTIKQSHIGGLKKEITKVDRKNAAAIGNDVVAAFTAIMLGQDMPDASSKASAPYLALIEKHREKILAIAEKAREVMATMLSTMTQESEEQQEKTPQQ